MSNTTIHYSEYIKQGIFIVLILALAIFGIKGCRKYQQKRNVIIQLSSCASESAAYEQFYKETAHANLFRAMYHLHMGTQLGKTPSELLKSVMTEDEALLSTEKQSDLPVRKKLIRDALLNNYENCIKLGVFVELGNLEALSKGDAPEINHGPASGELVVIDSIISSRILPGVDKLLPNMVISPPKETAEGKASKPNNFEIARAKQLAESLSKAGLIEREAHKAVVDHYDKSSLGDKPVGSP